jgi:hypothetical protein
MWNPSLVFIAFVTAATFPSAVPAPDRADGRRCARITFDRPTWVTNTHLIGTYLIEHDDARMTRGEPCTLLYRPGTGTDRGEPVVSFHCLPHQRPIVSNVTTRISRDAISGAETLTEYQFAGETEAHGVPILAFAEN